MTRKIIELEDRDYLLDRHWVQWWTVDEIAMELRLSYGSCELSSVRRGFRKCDVSYRKTKHEQDTYRPYAGCHSDEKWLAWTYDRLVPKEIAKVIGRWYKTEGVAYSVLLRALSKSNIKRRDGRQLPPQRPSVTKTGGWLRMPPQVKIDAVKAIYEGRGLGDIFDESCICPVNCPYMSNCDILEDEGICQLDEVGE